MIKITCTNKEKEQLLNSLDYTCECPFNYENCENEMSCEDCAKFNIEWEITT